LPLFAGWLLHRLLLRRLRLASPFVAQLPLASILDPPLCSHRLVVASHLVAPPPPIKVPPAHVLPLAAPFPYIRQLALSCTAIFVAPSLSTPAITGVLKCTAHSPDGGIANGHCSLLYGSRPPTRPPAPSHCNLYSSTIHHPCPTLVTSWRKVMTWRLFMFGQNLHLFVSPGQPCRGVHQDLPISIKFTLIRDGFSKIQVFSARFKC
jgi:hypothetical protein